MIEMVVYLGVITGKFLEQNLTFALRGDAQGHINGLILYLTAFRVANFDAERIEKNDGVHRFQRAVWQGDLLYIRTLHPGTYKIDPEVLYDLSVDPHMEHDLMSDQPERADPLKASLADWWHEYAGQPTSEPDKLQQNVRRGPVLYSEPERYLKRLETSGRSDLASDYRARLGGFLKDPHEIPAHEKPKVKPLL